MALCDYIESFEAVRAAVGVSDSELSDDTLGLKMYETQLGIALGQINPSLQGDYLVIAAKAHGERTAPENLVADRVQAFSAYAVASFCLPGLPLGAMKGEGDEKANYTRFGGDVHATTEERIYKTLDTLILGLTQAYNALQSAGTTVTRVLPTFLVNSAPSYDPVTG